MRRSVAFLRGKAEELLTRAGIDRAPVDVKEVARECGLQVRGSMYEGDLSGFLFQEGSRRIIGVNLAHAETRQRFTIAHEIGHFVLHSPTDKNATFVDHKAVPNILRRDSRSSAGVDPREIEANAFAAELLMPRRFIEADLEALDADQSPEEIIESLAEKYRVSQQAMTLRLERLGHLDQQVI